MVFKDMCCCRSFYLFDIACCPQKPISTVPIKVSKHSVYKNTPIPWLAATTSHIADQDIAEAEFFHGYNLKKKMHTG